MNRERILCLAVLLGLCSCSSQPDEVRRNTLPVGDGATKYDRFKDNTINMSAVREVADGLAMGFSFSCDGNSASCSPGFVLVDFYTTAPRRYADEHDAIFIADGERIQSASFIRKHPQAWRSFGGGVEMVNTALETTDFLRLAHAHSVEGQFGITEFTVRESDLEKWRSFASGIRKGKH